MKCVGQFLYVKTKIQARAEQQTVERQTDREGNRGKEVEKGVEVGESNVLEQEGRSGLR